MLRGAVADAVNDVLRGVNEPGGFGARLALGQPSAGKTGTSQNNRSVWFAGYTPNLSAAAMIAGANSLGHPISLKGQTIGGRYLYSASGSGNAGPIWGDAMKAIAPDLPDDDFRRPSGSSVLGVQVSVPSVSGMSMEDALEEVEDAGFEARPGNQINSSVAQGMAAGTSPRLGRHAEQRGHRLCAPLVRVRTQTTQAARGYG